MTLSRPTIKRRYNAELPRYERARASLVAVVESMLVDLGPRSGIRPVPIIESSVKEFDSFYEKACRFQQEGRIAITEDCFTKIHDIARARIVCNTTEDVDHIVRMVNEQTQLLYTGVETEAHAPARTTGYRAVHLNLDIDVQVGAEMLATHCELQVMTALQYAWGLYTHKDFYKSDDVPPLVATLMRELSDLLHVADCFAGHLIREAEHAAGTR
jgi:ppGpp synthetase/RelA/SpoT-type nucleotidyltranferase